MKVIYDETRIEVVPEEFEGTELFSIKPLHPNGVNLRKAQDC